MSNHDLSTPQKRLEYWTRYAADNLVGRRVHLVRYLSEEEKEAMGWYHSALVIEFDDGSLIFPSADDEGNDAGALFGQTRNGEELTFPVL